MSDYIEREAVTQIIAAQCGECADVCLEFDGIQPDCNQCLLHGAKKAIESVPAADVRPVSEIEKIIESLQEQADIYNARAQELLVEEDGQVSQYTWAVSLRETYRRIIKTLDDLIS